MIEIKELMVADLEPAYEVFRRTIPDAFEQEGLGALTDEICQEIESKRLMLNEALFTSGSSVHFLVARKDGDIVGTISIGPCNGDIIQCTGGRLKNVFELGSLYVLREYQGQGIGSALIKGMANSLAERGIENFCLDSGYRHAQIKWLHKFGRPYATVHDYWGLGLDHMVWYCKVSDYVG
ncbi:GNAT family N-acetyltransferase [Paenibacillus glycanilyticus]|uniref:GNAT family N-acetyltransferase n=1 Tax=Paenibacillus glycanilyticus TaxID=126569 RepID=UPI00203B3B4F|nr:GNAT family N-acetyltransferase [Paenibacillus glycanilyticus]MCM3628163.1 GNAT family N-acetyltransferase [Paenibacillus glycanilyticus]